MVKAWREFVTIPTYEVGKPEKNPMFLEKRVYQGSSGVVYPYPVIETMSDEKVDKEYKAVWLENEYIKVMVLPKLGGRVQMAYDKIRQRHFVYYNHVIKPALVGLVGPWISGGIEFNWPQHHRPTTYMPVDSTESPVWWKKAMKASPDYCFPNRLEDAFILKGLTMVPGIDARAHYSLGCLYYDKRQYDLAIENWEKAVKMDPQFPTAWRCLALARFNKQDKHEEAVEYMEKAFNLDQTDSRILMELDQLYKRMQKPHAERLAFLQKYPELIAQRDDLILEEITLLNQLGRYEEAMQKLDAHKFHPWEGGEGKVPAQYQTCRVELAKKAIAEQQFDKAKTLLEACLEYHEHLGEGKLYGAQENDFYYFLGCCYDALGNADKAAECWEEATKGPQEPAAAMYYNDAKPDKIFYQGLALLKLGRKAEANGRFYKLLNYGKQHIFDHVVMDYFAVSLPDLLIWEDSLDRKNEIHCKYMLALGYYGLGDKQKAQRYLDEVRELDINHQGIQALQTFIAQ